MYLPKDASRSRIREAQKARENRAENRACAVALDRSAGASCSNEGLFTSSGLLLWKNGLNVYAPSAYGQVPTGTPRSPLFGARKFTQPFRRLSLQTPMTLTNVGGEAVFPTSAGEPNAKRVSYHQDFNDYAGPVASSPFRNKTTNRGPMEGRPPGELFAHQRWDEFFPRSAT